MKKKITLCWPPLELLGANDDSGFPSNTIQYLSKFLEINGFETSVVDCGIIYSPQDFKNNQPEKLVDEVVQFLEETNPDILGFGSWTIQMPLVAEITRKFKARNPDVPIILGGANPTFLPNETLQLLPHIDFCVRGEGEHTLLELCQTLSSGKKIGKIKGISFRNKEGKIVHTPDRPLIKNLDELPLIDFENCYKPKYIRRYYILTTRGCMFNCHFCSELAQWSKSRYYSVDYVKNQLKRLNDLYGPFKYINIVDSTFFENRKRATKIAKMIKSNFPDLLWGAFTRIDIISKDQFSYYKKLNFSDTTIGIESIIPNTLIFLNKTPDPFIYIKRTVHALNILDDLEIPSFYNFIIGTPNETKEDMLKMEKFMQEIRLRPSTDSIGVGILMLYPGTKHWDMFKKGELKIFRAPGNPTRYFGGKYSHITWMTPEVYRVVNNYMSNQEYYELTKKIYENCILPR